MVHFLAHGEGGKYQHLFVNFMLDLNRGIGRGTSLAAQTSAMAAALKQHWKAYWLAWTPNPTDDVYARTPWPR